MSFAQAVDAFLSYCDLERALSPSTLIAYANDLKHFASFAAPHAPMQATEEDLKRFAHLRSSVVGSARRSSC